VELLVVWLLYGTLDSLPSISALVHEGLHGFTPIFVLVVFPPIF
jgi:hypothetical protein